MTHPCDCAGVRKIRHFDAVREARRRVIVGTQGCKALSMAGVLSNPVC